jgi:bifunctional UDP-N-acetylglucosamine pyrophosphorylase/glucosamine-1-phosphate N-acetyltransferase
MGDGAKASHLTYIGDSDVGRDVNLGCGVVFVNYDGSKKYRSVVKDGAFIGCNSNLVSPVTIEEGAYVAAGSTVTQDVPSDALYVARARARVLDGWVKKRGILKKK